MSILAACASVSAATPSKPARGAGPAVRAGISWEPKLRPLAQPRVVADKRLGGLLLVPTPLLVAEEVAAVRLGQILTCSELRARLARRFAADRTCPMTTGIFAVIVAGAVSEDLHAGAKARWPIWRLVGDDGRLHPNWPLPTRFRASLLRGEGHAVTRSGETWQVLFDAAAPGA